MSNATWYIGCSGFHYKHWKGTFYPEKLAQKKWFEFYCQHFLTLELNVTFYRFPQLSFLQAWFGKSPAEFRFSVKAPRIITHFNQFHHSADLISDFYNTIREGLGEKLGPVLFQMPPRFSYDEERLERVINSLDNSFLNVVEFRHKTWWNDTVYQALGKHNITFCGMSHPQLPDELIINSPYVYYRLHGVPDLYRSPYSDPFLKKLKKQVDNESSIKQSWVYFNNDVETHAVYDAIKLKSII
ncbi:DUF72 domain-containing protein [Pedobacter sp. HMF7647]|uniref:DUF72 domain-containing protein n=1 Tax=Hufsiella arboris TaxID=2695275 RepID=A0A7K1YEZ3_9SPHI|nr:DUF72 domain-containing protein [Hufsiella arboris]MXV53176.1 DUF72 domain-containing protein [Hufsiella arboris]